MTYAENDVFIKSLRKGDKLRFIDAQEATRLDFSNRYVIPFVSPMMYMCGRIFTFKDSWDFHGRLAIQSEEKIEHEQGDRNDGEGWYISAEMVEIYRVNEN